MNCRLHLLQFSQSTKDIEVFESCNFSYRLFKERIAVHHEKIDLWVEALIYNKFTERTMYAVIERNRLLISVAGFYIASWYEKDWPHSGKEKFRFEYGNLEIDIHKNGKKYLTGFVIDPRRFIVDYLKTSYKKNLAVPKQISSVSIDSSESLDLVSVDFFRAHSFVIDGMERDLIFPQFVRKQGEIAIQGFEVLSVRSVLRYLVKRFKYKGTTRIRRGDMIYNLETGRRWKIERKKRS